MKIKQKLRLSRKFTFEAAHALPFHDGKCKNIHGHSYILEICIAGFPLYSKGTSSDAMITDFVEIKNWVNNSVINDFDHCLFLHKDDARFSELVLDENQKIIQFDVSPTCEQILLEALDRLKNSIPPNLEIISLKLQETASSVAEWYLSDQS